MPKKPRPKVRLYDVIARAVEEGAAVGVNRAYKHTDAPSREGIAENVAAYVMLALGEVVDFGGE